MRIIILVSLFVLCVVVEGQVLNLFQGFQFPQANQPTAPLPPKKRVGRPPNQKLHACCRKLNQADKDCKRRFCDFNSLSSNTVSLC